MNTLLTKISEFAAAHKRFPTAVDFQRADTKLWEELTPKATKEFLDLVCISRHATTWDRIAFQYWLHWLQAVRFRATNELFTELCARVDPTFNLLMPRLHISRLKFGRRSLGLELKNNLFKLYLLSADERRKLKQEILNSNG